MQAKKSKYYQYKMERRILKVPKSNTESQLGLAAMSISNRLQ